MTRLIAGLAGAFAAVFGVLAYGWGQRRTGAAQAKRETALEAAERYAKTTERINDADATISDDPGVLRGWLRERPADKP